MADIVSNVNTDDCKINTHTHTVCNVTKYIKGEV